VDARPRCGGQENDFSLHPINDLLYQFPASWQQRDIGLVARSAYDREGQELSFLEMSRAASTIAILTVFLLAGCTQPPREPAEDARFEYKIARTPYSAAICIARNARRSSGNVVAEERLLDAGAMEVVVRSAGNPAGELAIARIRNDGGVFSAVSIMVKALAGPDREAFARRMLGDC
jgi:hypothetical protein